MGGHRKVGHNLVTKQQQQICILLQKDLKRSSESTLKHYYYHILYLSAQKTLLHITTEKLSGELGP